MVCWYSMEQEDMKIGIALAGLGVFIYLCTMSFIDIYDFYYTHSLFYGEGWPKWM